LVHRRGAHRGEYRSGLGCRGGTGRHHGCRVQRCHHRHLQGRGRRCGLGRGRGILQDERLVRVHVLLMADGHDGPITQGRHSKKLVLVYGWARAGDDAPARAIPMLGECLGGADAADAPDVVGRNGRNPVQIAGVTRIRVRALLAVAATALNWARGAARPPVGTNGVGTTLQLVPSKCSASG
jgi:hypothetical protein